ncbi:MAG: lipase [Oscillospiraceae bacterium]|nr:lipase [Oscillospiraceae bacterium]
MDKQTKQILTSFLAIIFCVAFLWAGKKYIWNNALIENQNPDDPFASDIVPDVTGIQPDLPGTGSAESSTVSSSSWSAELTGSTLTSMTSSDTALSSSTLSQSVSTDGAQSSTISSSATVTTASDTVIKPSQGFSAAPEGYFSDALFIGDSRMVGIASYAAFPGANYFATVGLATYKVANAKSEVDNKSVSFSGLLSSKQYGKIYIMLGINEIGNDRTTTMKKYGELIQTIRSAQPNAIIYLCANLHVTAKRSAKGDAINNKSINSFNEAVKGLCDGSTIYYLDINPAFDDASGCLRADYTNDGVHPLAKYYKEWAEWFKQNVIIR